MLYIALGMKLHLGPVLSTAIANVICAIGLGYVLLRLARQRFHWFYAFAIFGVLALVPQTLAAVAGFSVLPFGLAIATTVMFAEEGKDGPTALSALTLCLLRPDGVVFAIPIMVRRLYMFPKSTSIGRYAMLFVFPGVVYFVWRWHYFQHFLPLPFLVKSDTQRLFGIFSATSHALVRYLFFAAVVIGVTLGKRVVRRAEVSFLIAVIIVPSLFYSAMRLDQNVFFRFYYYVPIVAALIVAMYWNVTAWGRRPLTAAIAIALLVCFAKPYYTGLKEYSSMSAYWRRNEGIAKQLNTHAMHGTLLTSEAGEFAYFSRWETYDSWGLNTPDYAVRFIRPEDVVKLAPDVIAIHSERCPARITPTQTNRTFENMFANIQTGVAMMGDYQTWRLKMSRAAPDESLEVLCWYISDRYPGKAQVEAILEADGASRAED
jgi:hypothetical protein